TAGPQGPAPPLQGGPPPPRNTKGCLGNTNRAPAPPGRPRNNPPATPPRQRRTSRGLPPLRGGFNSWLAARGELRRAVCVPSRGPHRSFGSATWHPINVKTSSLCPCNFASGDTVYKNHVMGLYVPAGSPSDHTYLATVSRR